MSKMSEGPNPSPRPYPVDVAHVRSLLADMPDEVVSVETQEGLLRDPSYSNFWRSLAQSQRDALSSCVAAGSLDKQLLIDIFELQAGPSFDFTQGISGRLVKAGLSGIDSLIESMGPNAGIDNDIWGMLREGRDFNLWFAFASGRAVSTLDMSRLSSGGVSLNELRAFVENSGKDLTSPVLR